jgi:drug/metabolite transporter (DMT)-like permease
MFAASPRLVPLLLTVAALVAFAANSVLGRLALGTGSIDAPAFTAVRLGSGALALLALTSLRRGGGAGGHGSWLGAGSLLLYALPFSIAYLRLETGTGALLLFGTVQVTMITSGLRGGERPGRLEWLGFAGALGGLVYLVSPGLAAPDPLGALFMVVAGVGWGLYSLVGRGAGDPLAATASNIQRTALVLVPLTALAWPWLSLSPRGVWLAVASGALATGLGYTIWYAALRHLTATRAALVQLSVPALAAAGGVAFMDERVTLRLALACAVILGSIAIGTVSHARTAARTEKLDSAGGSPAPSAPRGA